MAPQIPAADPKNLQTSTPETTETDSACEVSTPQSHKVKRKQKSKRHDSAVQTPSTSDTESHTQPRKPPNNPPKPKHHPNPTDTIVSIPPSMSAKSPLQKVYPLLICSIGNPGSTYANTLHSAGHILTSYLAERKNYKPFQKGLSGNVTKPDNTRLSFALTGFKRVPSPVDIEEDWTFWQSTSLMNISGKGVNRAYTEWLRSLKAQYNDTSIQGRLVVVHDELESALGKVTIKDGGASAKGHNGLKSCQSSLGSTKWWRMGVGIGRPDSREPDVVAKYVLRKMSGAERGALEKSAVGVAKALEEIAGGQR